MLKIAWNLDFFLLDWCNSNSVPIFNIAGLTDRVPIPVESWFQASKALSHVSVQAEEVGNGWVGGGWGVWVNLWKHPLGMANVRRRSKKCCECCCYTPTSALRLFDWSSNLLRPFLFDALAIFINSGPQVLRPQTDAAVQVEEVGAGLRQIPEAFGIYLPRMLKIAWNLDFFLLDWCNSNSVPIFNIAGLTDRVPIPVESWFQASKALSHVSVQAEEVGNGWVGGGWGVWVNLWKHPLGMANVRRRSKKCCECCCYTPTSALRLFDWSSNLLRPFLFDALAIFINSGPQVLRPQTDAAVQVEEVGAGLRQIPEAFGIYLPRMLKIAWNLDFFLLDWCNSNSVPIFNIAGLTDRVPIPVESWFQASKALSHVSVQAEEVGNSWVGGGWGVWVNLWKHPLGMANVRRRSKKCCECCCYTPTSALRLFDWSSNLLRPFLFDALAIFINSGPQVLRPQTDAAVQVEEVGAGLRQIPEAFGIYLPRMLKIAWNLDFFLLDWCNSNSVPIFNIAGLTDRVPIPVESWFQASKALSHVSVQAEEVGNGWVGGGWGVWVNLWKHPLGMANVRRSVVSAAAIHQLRLSDCSIGVPTFYVLFRLMPLQSLSTLDPRYLDRKQMLLYKSRRWEHLLL